MGRRCGAYSVCLTLEAFKSFSIRGAAALQPTEGGTQAGDDQGLQVPAMGATHVWQN